MSKLPQQKNNFCLWPRHSSQTLKFFTMLLKGTNTKVYSWQWAENVWLVKSVSHFFLSVEKEERLKMDVQFWFPIFARKSDWHLLQFAVKRPYDSHEKIYWSFPHPIIKNLPSPGVQGGKVQGLAMPALHLAEKLQGNFSNLTYS